MGRGEEAGVEDALRCCCVHIGYCHQAAQHSTAQPFLCPELCAERAASFGNGGWDSTYTFRYLEPQKMGATAIGFLGFVVRPWHGSLP